VVRNKATMTNTATNSSPGADLKRVISNPETLMAESDREEKKTRVEDGMENLALDNEDMGPNSFPISATMSHDDSRLSSLSSGEGSNSDDDDDDEDNDKVDGGVADNNQNKAVIGGPPLKNRSNNRIKRQVSHDGSLTNSNSSAENRQSSVTGNWGWFEDVHGHESAFLPGFSASLSGGGGESLSGGNNKGDGKEKKKSGIWKMGSDLMQSALSSIVEPHRQGA
jgi:hypothetical protein